MNDHDTVSILIPVYNGEAFLAEAIQSVLSQTVPVSEILVADDGSTDRSAEIAETFSKVRVLRLEHKGISATRNALIREATGKWILFLDADDLLRADTVEKLLGYVGEHSECEICFCRFRNFTDIPDDELTDRQRKVLNILVDHYIPGALIRRELFTKHGDFEEQYAFGEDTEWTTRLSLRGVNLDHCLEDVFYLRRIHNDNITLSHRTIQTKEYLALWAKAIRNAGKRKD